MDIVTPLIRRRLLLLLIVSAIVFATVAAMRITYRRFQLSRSLTDVEREIAELELQQSALTDSLASFNEFATIEQTAREVLNLQREGEQVVILLPNGQEVTQEDSSQEEALELKEPTNPVKWWAYFFGEKASQ